VKVFYFSEVTTVLFLLKSDKGCLCLLLGGNCYGLVVKVFCVLKGSDKGVVIYK